MTVDRRTFLKGVGVGTAGCALTSILPGSLAALEHTHLQATGINVASICEMCSTRCPISARVVNNTNVAIVGNSNAKAFGGAVCARGGAGHSQLYDKDRIVKPLKRVGARGEGNWQEIEWDEAYQIMASKLADIKQKYGAETVAFAAKSGSMHTYLFQLAAAYGSPNTFTHESLCPGSYKVAAKAMFGSGVKRDLSNSKYIINFGHNLYEGINMSETRGMMQAQMDRNAKLVVFEPRFSIVADKADEWFPIKPGTDITVALALCHVLINDELYDKAFVERYVSGFDEFAAQVQNYTPEWAQSISDVPAQAIRRIAYELVEHAPHAVVDFGHRSTFTTEEFELRRAIYAANVLIGNIERKGGIYFGKKASSYNKYAGETVAPELKKFKVANMPKIAAKRIDSEDSQFTLVSQGGGVYQTILDSALEAKPYQLRGLVMSRTNPMQTLTDRTRVQRALEKLDFVVACDIYISESAAYADLFLPESTYLERDEEIFDKSGKNPAYYVRQKVVEPLGNTKPSWQIWREVGEALGLGQYFPMKDMTAMHGYQCDGNMALVKQIKTEGFVAYGKPLMLREPQMVKAFTAAYSGAIPVDDDGTYGSQLKFKTPTGKIELTSAKIEQMAPDRGLIKYRHVELKKANELYFIQGKVAVHTNGASHNVPMLAELMSDNAVWINTVTAAQLGIQSGDKIRIYNDQASEFGHALVTPGIRPDTVFAYMGFGSKNKELKRAVNKGVHCGNLLPHVISPVTGMCLHTTGVMIEKA